MTSPIAVLHDVRFSYDNGDTWALDDVDLTIGAGERVAIVGANGSGKSTLGRLIAGLAAPDSGTIDLLDEPVFRDGRANASAYRAAWHGIGAVFQNPEDQIVTTVTEDDVAFGPENLGVPRERIGERIGTALRRVGMDGFEANDPTRMSGGQQQRVAIAGMLAMRPRMLVLDEPTAMLDESGREEIMRVLGELHDHGVTIVHITHAEDEAALADRVIRMDHGRIVGDGVSGAAPLSPPYGGQLPSKRGATAQPSSTFHTIGSPLRGEPSAQQTEGSPRSIASTSESPTSSPIISLSHVSFSYAKNTPVLTDVNLTIEPGETVAIMGHNGCGKSTLTRLLCALEAPNRGSITVDGIPVARDTGRGAKPLRRRDRKRLRATIGYVMQHPERQLFAETVAEDVAFGPRNLGLDGSELDERVSQTLKPLGLSHLAGRSPFDLSGGQQRMVAIAGILAWRPKILVMDEPTSSLDTSATQRIHTLIDDLRTQGVTVIIVTHDRAEAELADRVITLGDHADDDHRPAESRQPRPSFIAALDPRVKMVLFLIMMFTAFAIGTPMQLAVAALTVTLILAASRLGPVSVLHSVRMLLALFVVMSALNVFFVRTGTPLAHIGPIPITDDGLWTALVYAGRLALVVILGAIMLGTTTPVRLTDAFGSLLSPLSRIGVHTGEIALTMSLALRFIPTLTQETRDVIDAQSARGGSIESGTPMQRLQALTAIIVPVFAGALRHADNLGLALDARSYEGGAHRTHYRMMRVGGRDIAFAGMVVVYLAALIALAFIA
ncbi:energy-coupling factor transporter ATPase [Bifidobacterium callimiconis]|uniref:Cobalt ABC transporter n=1 Tax=Bifidobacterium callimiconis TaxID=2306973 RepID=A0A430FGM5_9BIFI|nr:energy-coupling factor transporter ATPase [Bifidobacterium callimiconis]RSX51922.1 cobalt ABC transporter [Bifidobacterium callimiconis]